MFDSNFSILGIRPLQWTQRAFNWFRITDSVVFTGCRRSIPANHFLPGKLPAILPDGLAAEINSGSWPVLPIFKIIQKEGGISDDEMYRVFNMGLGMVAVCPEDNVANVLEHLPDAMVIGKMIPKGNGEQVVFRG